MANSACMAITGSTSQAGCKTTADDYGFQSHDFSAGIWVRFTSYSNTQNGCMGTSNGSNGWSLRVDNTSHVNFTVAGVGTSTMTATIGTGAWYFVAVTKVSASTNKLYFITNAGAVTVETVTSRTVNANTGDFYVGASGSQANSSVNGNIAHAQVWDRVLTQNELLTAAMSPGSVTQNLLSYWPLYGQFSPEQDLGHNQRTLTVNTGATGTSTNAPMIQIPLQSFIMSG